MKWVAIIKAVQGIATQSSIAGAGCRVGDKFYQDGRGIALVNVQASAVRCL